MIGNAYAGLGDLWQGDTSTQLLNSILTNKPWRQLVFGDSGAGLSLDRQRFWRNRIQNKYSQLRQAGQLSPEDAADASVAANHGVMLIPAVGQFAFDPDTKAAVTLMLQKTGLLNMFNELLAEMKRKAEAVGASLQTKMDALDKLYTGMYYVSGAVALDKLNEKWTEIVAGVREAQTLIDTASRELDDAGYRRVRDECLPINAQVEKLSAYFPTAEAPGLSGIQAVAAIVIGAALIVASVVAALVVKMLSKARNIYAEESARMLRERENDVRGDYSMELDNIQAEYEQGLISAEDREARLSAAKESRDSELVQARTDWGEQQAKLPSSGVGGLSLGLGAGVAAGILVLVLVMGRK